MRHGAEGFTTQMKFVVFGTSEFTLRCATALLDSGREVCVLISMPQELRPLHPADITGLAKCYSIP